MDRNFKISLKEVLKKFSFIVWVGAFFSGGVIGAHGLAGFG